MNALVIYDSKYGNTEKIAQAITDVLAYYGKVRMIHVEEVRAEDLEGIELLAIGGPTQGHGLSPAVDAFLDTISGKSFSGLPILSFDTRMQMPAWLSGSAADHIEKRLSEIGCSPLMPHESFFVTGGEGPLGKGEIERAGEWVRLALEVAGYRPGEQVVEETAEPTQPAHHLHGVAMGARYH